jgi:hypothetical protein
VKGGRKTVEEQKGRGNIYGGREKQRGGLEGALPN